MEKLKGKEFIVEAILEMFPFVMWDRFIFTAPNLTAYGWITRGMDTYKDFIVLYFNIEKQELAYLTSSAEKHEEIEKIFKNNRQPKCERIEHYFNIKNSIKL